MAKIGVIASLPLLAGLWGMPISLSWAAPQSGQAIGAPTESADMRVARIGYRLAKANAGKCPQPEMMTGMALHDLGAYDEKDRALIQSHYGLGQGFGILAIVAGSAADKAGLHPGEEIIGLNGSDLASFASGLIRRNASYDRVGAFEVQLAAALRAGPVTLLLRQGAVSRSVNLAGDSGCNPKFVVYDTRELNAWSDGDYAATTTRMVDFAGSDDALATVLAHEMAHNILGHNRHSNEAKAILAEFGIGAAKIKRREREADAFAVHLVAAAGFDPAAGIDFYRRIDRQLWANNFLALTHPRGGERGRIIAAEIAKLRDPATGPSGAEPDSVMGK